jgi:hypothetical protein
MFQGLFQHDRNKICSPRFMMPRSPAIWHAAPVVCASNMARFVLQAVASALVRLESGGKNGQLPKIGLNLSSLKIKYPAHIVFPGCVRSILSGWRQKSMRRAGRGVSGFSRSRCSSQTSHAALSCDHLRLDLVNVLDYQDTSQEHHFQVW